MDKCDLIRANVKMEECYAGLSLSFDRDEQLREEIENAIALTIEKTELKPLIFDNSNEEHREEHQSIYLEFSDEVQRDSGAFFEMLLKELGIHKCVNEVIDYKVKGNC